MNILIVTAHPSSKGDTHTIANTYANAKIAKGDVVKIVDLYAKEYSIDLLRFENLREFTVSPVQKKFHELLVWANEIVVVHPIWWGTPPSIMKNWVELTFWPGVAYKYTHEGKLVKLFDGKSAKVFATAGGPAWIHYLYFFPLHSFWRLSVFGFSGVDLVDLKVCGNLDIWRDEKRAKHLEKFIKAIKASAR